MDVALSRNGRRVMRVFFGLVVLFLYAPIVILIVFSRFLQPRQVAAE